MTAAIARSTSRVALASSAMVVAVCPRCTSVVELHEGRPFVTAHGTVELWHRACWDVRDVPLVVATAEPAPIVSAPIARRRSPRLVAVGGVLAGSAVLAIVIAQQAAARSDLASSMVNVELSGIERPSLVRSASASNEVVPPKPARTLDLEDQFPVPHDDHDVPLDEKYPTLRGWLHPITGASQHFPWSPGRHFGAPRNGVERAECGEGHCGVDLDGPHGRALVAVAAGVIVRVERREQGGDGRSGRYIRMQHEDGTLTSYMHMDEIDAALQTGDRVEQGQYLGTLGATGVSRSAPHLHFSLEVPRSAALRGDLAFSATQFIDPAPYLLRATIAEAPQRRHALKPAF
jgi:murein DD-endopeptidase MepM/ murein hydrolase activator NlpD